MPNTIRLMPICRLASLCLALIVTVSCAREPIPKAFQGLDDQQMAATLSDTTTLYQTKKVMHFEYLGSKGEYREWSSSRSVLVSGTWSVSDGDICQHVSDSTNTRTLKHCKKKSDKVKYIAAVFSGDALKLSGRENFYCKINYQTIQIGNTIKPDAASTVFALTAAAALMGSSNKDAYNNTCEEYVRENQKQWFLTDKHSASKLLDEIKYRNENGLFIDIAKFDVVAPNYLTPEGIVVFRRYYQITNSLTTKGDRARKFF